MEKERRETAKGIKSADNVLSAAKSKDGQISSRSHEWPDWWDQTILQRLG